MPPGETVLRPGMRSAVPGLLFAVLVACAPPESAPSSEAEASEQALTTCAQVKPSPKPMEVVNYCKTLPGVNANGVLDCIKGAAASPTPAVVVNACSSLPGVNAEGVLTCISALTQTPRP